MGPDPRLRRSFRWRTIHHGMILKGKKRGSVAPHREHVALPTIVLQLARIRVPQWGQANARRGFPSTIRVLDMNWEPYPLPKLRTSPIPQTVWCGHSLHRQPTMPLAMNRAGDSTDAM